MTPSSLPPPRPAGGSELDRRGLLGGLAALGGLGLTGCVSPVAVAQPPLVTGRGDPGLYLAPLRASIRRIFEISVCTRPFRAAGPRLDAETIGDALVVHNYGHGGSGWSLSWGSSAIAVQKALAGSPREIAVIGSGPLGLTSALLAQSAGTQVTIYARELVPEMPSLRATGSFTPDSRIALTDAVDPAFPALWEQMARASYHRYNELLGLPGDPVQWVDRYTVSDPGPRPPRPRVEGELDFASYEAHLGDLLPRGEAMEPGSTPFHGFSVRRGANLMFNLASYANMLVGQFRQAGGRIERREFHAPGELAQLPQKVVINCTGYGARALLGDESVVPVRGQIAWLIPQREFDYALAFRGVNVVPRTDGIGVQAVSGGDMRGYGDDSAVPDRAEAEEAVATLAELYARFGR
ncbi:MAG TPA: FAD-dependent oxidoreductase [Croceibacterium sp.]